MMNRPESRHSQDVETQKEFPPPVQPHAMPNKARSPTLEEVSKIMRRMRAETKELTDETLRKSKEKSANRLFHERDMPPSAPLPRQSKRGGYTPRTPSGTPRSGNINWGESLLAQPNFLLDNQESCILNAINSIHKKIEETSHHNTARLVITLERMANAIDALTEKISKQTDLLKDLIPSQNSEKTEKYPWTLGQEKDKNTCERFTRRTTSESMLEYHQRLDRDAKEILLPRIGEDNAERRHRSEVRRRIGMYQRFGQTSIPDKPLEQRGDNKRTSHSNERSPFQPWVKSPKIKEPLREKISPVRNPPKERSPLESDPVKAGEQEEYLEKWYEKAIRMAEVRILTPYPEGVRLEILKNGPAFPDKKWSGENDMESFWQWFTELLGFLASQGCKGPQFDEVHLDCLIRRLGGPAFNLGIRLQDEALLRGDEGMFLEVLNTLMRTFIKASATLNVTKKYRNVKYEAEKGLKQFYLALSKAASQMVMPPDQVSFNARFLNYIPLEWKREMIAHDRIRADFSSNEEMIKAISQVDEIIDGLKMSSAHKSGYYT